jgi:sialate O-acetylesterase
MLRKLLFITLAAFLAAGRLSANPRLPHIFSDHMVLQREMPIAVWGWADASEKITVKLGPNSRSTVAAADTSWSVSLPALPAGGPFLLRVEGKSAIELKDVMIGEVWVASGQSNMAFALEGAANAETEIAKAALDQIRLFMVPQKVAQTPQSDTLPTGWTTCAPDTAKKFSAVGYFFAKRLYESLGVPIGIIESAWPGSSGEEWTDPEALRTEPILQPILKRWAALPLPKRSGAVRSINTSLEFDDFELVRDDGSPVSFSNFDNGSSRTSTGGDWSYTWSTADATSFDLAAPGRGGKGFAARVAGKLDIESTALLGASIHADHSPADWSAYSGIRFWVRGQGAFKFQSLQPTIFDWDNYSSPILQATPGWRQITISFKDLKQAGWGIVEPLTLDALTGFQFDIASPVGELQHPPSGLYDGMITPLAKFRIRGALWYQGESNTYRSFQYQTLLPALIRGWRQLWKEGDFPFLIVQLPNHGGGPELSDSIWAEMREAELLTVRRVANTGLAVTIDVGEPGNLHPPRKMEVGDRLAYWALGTTYGEKIGYSGPLYKSMKVEGDAIHVSFDFIGGGLEARGQGGELRGFSIAGADHKFHFADARIQGDAIAVSSPDVAAPVAVRYAWADSPDCNLYNKEGFPASPFRTDDWPGASFKDR